MKKKIFNFYKSFAYFSTKEVKIDKNLYEILEINPRVSQLEIKKAYLRLAKIYHPDIYKGADTKRFKEIQEAYELLKIPEKRKIYDKDNNFQSLYSEKTINESESDIYDTKKFDIDLEKEFEKFFSKKIEYTPDMVQVVDDPFLRQLNENERLRYDVNENIEILNEKAKETDEVIKEKEEKAKKNELLFLKIGIFLFFICTFPVVITVSRRKAKIKKHLHKDSVQFLKVEREKEIQEIQDRLVFEYKK